MKQIVVIGGGISGLSTCYFLRKLLNPAKYSIHLYEASSKWGGWIDTVKISSENSKFLFERGPRGFRPSRNGAEVLNLVEELDLKDLLLSSSEKSQARYIYQNRRVQVGRKILENQKVGERLLNKAAMLNSSCHRDVFRFHA